MMQIPKLFGRRLLTVMLLLSTLFSMGCCLMSVCLTREPKDQIVLQDNTVQLISAGTFRNFSSPKYCLGVEATARLFELAKKGKACTDGR